MSRSVTARPQHQFLAKTGAVLDSETQIPLHFGDVSRELSAFSEHAALISRSHTSRLLHEGEDALDLLNRLSTNDLLQLETGRSVLTILTSERGRVIDLLNVARFRENSLLLLTESLDPDPAMDWIERFTIIEDAIIRDVSDELAGFAVIGPSAKSIVQKAFGRALELGDVATSGEIPDEAKLVLSNWGGLDRVDVVVPMGMAEQAWDRLSAAGALPAGEQALEATRISRGIPLQGSELTDASNPLEAGLKHLISFTKGCYVGQEVVARLDTYDKLQRRLMALDTDGELTVESELTADNKRAGVVTSVSSVPISGSPTALAYVRRGYWEDGTELACGTAKVIVRDLPRTSADS